MAVPTKDNEKRQSQSDRRRARANRRATLPAIAGCVADIIILTTVNPDARANAWNLIWWLSPAVFILWVMLAGVQGFRRADEYQQRVQLESMAAGFLVAMIAAVAFLLLEAARIHTSAAGQWVFWGGAAAWGGTLMFKSLRTR
jgi:cation transport ATPase